MKNTYITPVIKEFRLQSGAVLMNNQSLPISDKEETDPTSDQSKAFWGSSLIDDEEEETSVDTY